MKRILPLLCFLFLLAGSRLFSQTYQPNWASLDARATPQWWQDAKFGIFIHWGMYSVPAYTPVGRYSEWYQNSLQQNDPDGKISAFHRANFGTRTYYDLADDFHAELFEPDAWAKLFEQSGAKYVVLTSKHHDGFCLWPSKESDRTWGFPWNSVSRGPKRDLLGDLFTALQKTSVKPGLYYSLYEWYNPLWKFDHARYAKDHMMPQLRDVVSKYKPWVVWADGDWEDTPETWKSQEFLAWLYNESPMHENVVTNDRWGSGVRFHHGGIYTPEYQPDIDFEDHAWEESRGMGYSYGYNRAEDAWDYNSAQALIMHLLDKVSRGGNFLLDIGPDAHGKIPPIMQERLLDMGQWLAENGEAIYGTRRWRTPSQWSEGNRMYQNDGKTGDLLLRQTVDPAPGFAVKEVFFTWKPAENALYAILPKYPADKSLVLKDIQLPKTADVTLLATKEKLRFEVSGNNTIVTLPEYLPGKFKSAHAFAIKIGGYGAFVARPKIKVTVDPKTLNPTIAMTSHTSGATIYYTLDGTEPTEKSTAYAQPIQPDKAVTLRARAFMAALLPSIEDTASAHLYSQMPAMSLFRQPDPQLLAQVLSVDQYNSKGTQEGNVEKTFLTSSFELDPSCQTGKCAMIFRGYLDIPQTAGYQFWLDSDDGSLLYLDNDLIVNNDGDHGMENRSEYALLQQGWHAVKLVYFNSGGAAGLHLYYAVAGGEKQEVQAGMWGH